MHSGLSRFIASSVCGRQIEGVRCRLLANTGEVDRPPAASRICSGSAGLILARSSSSPILVDLYGAAFLSVTTEGDVAIGVVGVVGWTGDFGSTRLHRIDGDAHWTRSIRSTCYVCSLGGVGVNAIGDLAESNAPGSRGGISPGIFSLGGTLGSSALKELHGATAFGGAGETEGAVFIVGVVLGAGDLGRRGGYANGRDSYVVQA